MISHRRNILSRIGGLRWGALVYVGVILFSLGCSGKKEELVGSFDKDQEIPTLRTEDVLMLISDSGITKYRVTAKEWNMFSKAKEPYEYFPRGFFVESFDSLYQTSASIEGDTAYFYKNKKLWHLIGNVRIRNVYDERFTTDELFWDQRTQRIYSDAFIHIEKKDVILEGVGFESNEALTKYTIRVPSGIFPIADKPVLKSDSLETDSLHIKKDTLQ